MPRQILTIELDGLTAGDYLAHVSDPEPPALGSGLRSIAVRAEPRGRIVEAVLHWDDCVPAPRVAAQAAGLPLIAAVASIEARALQAVPSPERRVAPAEAAPASPPSRLSALLDRGAGRLAAQAHMVPVQPLILRWA